MAFHGAGLLLVMLAALGFVGWVWGRRLAQAVPTIDDLKLLLIFFVLVILAVLAVAIALGDVKQETSYGLNEVLIAISGFAGAGAGYAFGSMSKGGDKP